MFHVMYKNICHWPKREGLHYFSGNPCEKHATDAQAVHLFIVAPSKLIVKHVVNFSREDRSLQSSLFHPTLRSTLPHTFRNFYKRRNTSNLDSRLKNWKTIFSVVLECLSKYTSVERLKRSKMLSLPLVLLLFRQFSPAIGFNILGICPSASYSHQQPFQALMKALAARGHNVTMISTIPSKVSAIFSPSPFLLSLFSFSLHFIPRRSPRRFVSSFSPTTPLNRSSNPPHFRFFSLSLSLSIGLEWTEKF